MDTGKKRTHGTSHKHLHSHTMKVPFCLRGKYIISYAKNSFNLLLDKWNQSLELHVKKKSICPERASASVPTLKPASLTCSLWLDQRLVSAAYIVATDWKRDQDFQTSWLWDFIVSIFHLHISQTHFIFIFKYSETWCSNYA